MASVHHPLVSHSARTPSATTASRSFSPNGNADDGRAVRQQPEGTFPETPTAECTLVARGGSTPGVQITGRASAEMEPSLD
jgi:hypothetical protein